MFCRIIALSNEKQFLIMKNVNNDKKFVIDIFTQSPDKHKKDIPFILYFQQVFENQKDRDAMFRLFDEITAISFLTQMGNSLKVQTAKSKNSFLN